MQGVLSVYSGLTKEHALNKVDFALKRPALCTTLEVRSVEVKPLSLTGVS